MSNPEIPSVKYVSALQADNLGNNAPVLQYTELHNDVAGYAVDAGRRMDIFFDQEPGSIEELAKARQLAFEYWLATADKVVTSGTDNRDLWADRYTEASVELFGAPDQEEAAREIAHQKSLLDGLRTDSNVDQEKLEFVLAEYEKVINIMPEVVDDAMERKNEADFELAVNTLEEEIKKRFSPVFDIVDRADKESFNQEELVAIFNKVLEVLAEIDDQSWSEWEVTCPDKGTAISVNGKEAVVKIPKKRGPADKTEVKKLLGHELLTHGLRPKNGKKSTDEYLGKGYPSFLDGEEGLAILMGAAASDGKVADVVHDRYVDVAFAMGVIGESPKRRSELFELAYARRLVRAQHDGESIDEAALKTKTSKYVDRIFRGSPGDDVGTRQAVYTADIYYYKYKNIASYIADKLREGYSSGDLFDYLMQGKFDPMNPQHVERVTAAHSQ